MKRNILTVILGVLAGGLTALFVVKAAMPQTHEVVVSGEGSQYRTVNLSLDDYPDLTYAAESAVDAVVYVKVTVKDVQRNAPSSLFDFFFGYLQSRILII